MKRAILTGFGGFHVGVIPKASLGSTGNVSITGLDFTPKLVRFTLLPTDGTTVMNMAHGAMTPSSQFFTCYLYNARQSGTDAAFAWMSNSTTLALKFSYVSMDSNGFTINVSTASSTFDVAFEAYA